MDVRDAQSIDAIRYQSVCRQLKENFQMPRKLSPLLDQLMPITILGQVFFTMERFYTAPVYNITDIVDRVGSGDSFMAGIIYGLIHGLKMTSTFSQLLHHV